MSLSATLSTAVSGLSTAQRALGVTAHNVANVNTEGYTRKVARQETLVIDGRGVGARALDTGRVVDDFLRAELRTQGSSLGRSEVLTRFHERLQGSVFGEPGDDARGLPRRIAEIAGAAEALANSPEKAALAADLVGSVGAFAQQLRDDAARVQAFRGDADREIMETIDQANGDVAALFALNAQIARAGAAPDLLDRQDALVASLAQKLDVTVARQSNETLSVYLPGGQVLLESSPQYLHYAAAAQVGEGTVFGAIRLFRGGDVDPQTLRPVAGAVGNVLVTGGVRARLTPELAADGTPDAAQQIVSPLGAGRLQGLLEVRDRLLPDLTDQLGELGELARFTLNKAHNTGVPLPPPTSLTGTRTGYAGFDPAANAGSAYLAVVDRTTRATVALVPVDVTAGGPAAIAAAVDAGLGGLGSAAIGADGRLRITLTDPAHGLAIDEGTSRIRDTDAAGHARDYGFSHYFGLNDLVVRQGPSASALGIRPDIAANPSFLSQTALAVAAGPPPTAALAGAGSSAPARALAASLRETVATVDRGGLPGRPVALGAYAADIVSRAAIAADRASTLHGNQQALVDDLAFRSAGVSGVNLDEELARLVQYQQAYTVSARIISITDELFAELVNMKR